MVWSMPNPGRARGAVVQVFDIGLESEARRLDAWQAIVSDTFVSLDCSFRAAEGLAGSITTTEAGPLAASLVDTVGQDVDRRRRHITDNAEVVLVSCQLTGDGVIEQGGRQVHLRPGEFSLYDSTRPYRLRFEHRFKQLVLQLPRDLVRRRLGPVRHLTATKFGADAPTQAMASAYLQQLGGRLGQFEDGLGEDYCRIAFDLIALAIERQTGQVSGQRRPAAGIREQALQIIRRDYAEAGLSTPEIARRTGISTRRLQEVFGADGTTPMEALWQYRLDQARMRLQDPARLSITEIAMQCGFADSAQFSRRFRDAFGLTPSDARRRGATDPARR